jgi:hydroxymethylpyrimidine/phosphomethylpyrimidine kinase
MCSFLPSSFVAEVGMNLGYALPHATTHDHVCALNGRLIKTKEGVQACGNINFGVSKHIASVILAATAYDSTIRCAINLRYSKQHLALCKKAGFTIGTFDRKKEPQTASSTMEWGTTQAIQAKGGVPDVIYDTGGLGKEPMIRVLGKNPADIIQKIKTIASIMPFGE